MKLLIAIGAALAPTRLRVGVLSLLAGISIMALATLVYALHRREPECIGPLYREDDDGVQPFDPYPLGDRRPHTREHAAAMESLE